ncbi:hypothetical protein C0J52_00031 [Blattella germanica]|nr:hypothetical protein C0J52_00031 [Blattella germanica]
MPPIIGGDDSTISDEEYLVLRAKDALKSDPYAAKAWMITAKALFPNNFAVQFEAYQIEKAAKNVKEAAKCFSAIFKKFQDETEMWGEVQALTTSLRSDTNDADAVFHRDMFSHIPLGKRLRSEFPRLVDTLMTAEKHCHYQNAVNCYRKLLVCDLLPLLGSSAVDLPPKQLFKLLHKSIEFYLCYLMSPSKAIQDLPELESKIEDPWKNLFTIQEQTGRKLGWELSAMFGHSWNKDLYWQKIVQFHQSRSIHGDEHPNHKQLLYCTTTFFLHCLHEYVVSLDSGGGDLSLVLAEAFCGDADGANASASSEFAKLSQHLKLESWLHGFLIDAALYKGRFDDALNKVSNSAAVETGNSGNLRKHLRLVSLFYCQGQYIRSLEHILQVVASLPSSTASLTPSVNQLTNVLIQPNQSNRHLHFLPLSRPQILQYCIKLLVSALKRQSLTKPRPDCDLAIGHIITLLQYDWPLEEELMTQLMDRIRRRGSFSYSLFLNYVVSVDVLEEFMYLSTDQGGSISLDILPSAQLSSQRRISTRGADKGVKEDFKLAMKRQVARSIEPLDNLIIKFLTSERDLLLQALQ